MAYFSIANFSDGVESGLIWLKTGGFLKFYSGNTGGKTEQKKKKRKICKNGRAKVCLDFECV